LEISIYKIKGFCAFDRKRENAFHVVSGNWQRTDEHSHWSWERAQF